MIPCFNCLVLAACKNKKNIVCDLLFDYMKSSIKYSDYPNSSIIRTKLGVRTWEEVDFMFQKHRPSVILDSTNEGKESFIIECKDKEAEAEAEAYATLANKQNIR